MAVTYGFYNALNHDRLYDAIQMSSIFDGIIQDGIFSTIGTSMIVTAPEDGMFVDVGPGRAWFNHTWTLNDTELPVEAEAAEVVLDRIDAVILEVNSAAEVRANSIKFLKGTPSSNPVKPTLTHNAEVNQYALAYVTIRAGQTTIFQQDIENVIGTDETPFVTGLLQQLSIERLLLQWDDEFHRYFANFKRVSEADLNTWFNARKDEYDAWYADMEREGAEDLATFDAWFQHMKDQLDEDAAGHLQAEIDDLTEQCEKGSVVTVTTEEASLIGRSCTISQGLNSVVKTFDSNGVAEFPSIPYVGNDIDVRATNGDNIAQGTLTIPYFGRYGIEIDFWAATLDIHSTVEALYGRTLTVSKGGSTVGTTTFDNTGHATFKVHETGTYHISASTAGGDVYETDVTVTEETVYPISLGLPNGQTVTPVNDIQMWLKCAGITDKAYLTTLADVLNEPATYETLLSDSNACDYLARSTAWSGGKDLVPQMTSDTTPSGEVSASSVLGSGLAEWRAFNSSEVNGWIPATSEDAGNPWIQYDFGSAKVVNSFTVKSFAYGSAVYKFRVKISGSDDGSTFTDLATDLEFNNDSNYYNFSFNNLTAYRYYRMTYTYRQASTYNVNNGIKLQFGCDGITTDATAMATLGKYDYACEALLGNATWAEAICASEYWKSVLDITVPTMTSATTPSGVVTCSSEYTGRNGWRAFSGGAPSTSNFGWCPNSKIADSWVQYEFSSDVVVHKVDYRVGDAGGVPTINLKVQGTNNGTITDLATLEPLSDGAAHTSIINNDTSYNGYRILDITGDIHNTLGLKAQFYGRHAPQTGIIHSAPVDTIYYISAGQQMPVCVTDADGIGHFDLDDLPKGSLTLYSTVAKDPDNLSNAYSKQFTITSNTTELWLMPDGALYWYGWKDKAQSCSGSYIVVYNTNSVRLNPHPDNATYSGICSKDAITGINSVHYIGYSDGANKHASASFASSIVVASNQNANNISGGGSTAVPIGTVHTYVNNSNPSGSYYPAVKESSYRTIDVYALWYE